MNNAWLKTVAIIITISAIIGLAIASIANTKVTDNQTHSMDRSEVETIVKEYLSENPEVIIEAINNYQRTSQERQAEKAREFITANIDAIENDPTSPSFGNPEGDIVVVEFFDYLCGYCKKAFPNLVKLVEEDQNVKVVLKEFPILSENSTFAAQASLAVFLAEPNNYLAYHQELITKRITGKAALEKVATDLGINPQIIRDAFDSPEIAKILVQTRQLADDLGVGGTPAFIVGGEFIPGYVDYEGLKAIIADIRAQ